MNTSQEGTPPHLPTYNVVLSDEQIRAIVSIALPSHKYISSSKLASGKSFNNRIYFIEVQQLAFRDSFSIHEPNQQYVLKLSGHYFGASKVRNEVGALQLFRTYCPSIPTPQVFAWSEEGVVVQTIDGSVIDTRSDQVSSAPGQTKLGEATVKHGWILMTRLPGRPLTFDDLESPSGRNLIEELASHIATWRKSIPSTGEIGNLRPYDPEVPSKVSPPIVYNLSSQTKPLSDTLTQTHIQDPQPAHLQYTVGGLLLCYQYNPTSLPSTLEYYKYLATDQLLHLKAIPALAPLRNDIAQEVEKFIDDVLPNLAFFQPSLHVAKEAQRGNTSTFTTFDLSPRNILVSEVSALPSSFTSYSQAPRHPGTANDLPITNRTEDNTSSDTCTHITGIIDLEFSGLFPVEEEFINLLVRQGGDWPEHHFRALLQHLEQLSGGDVGGIPVGIAKFDFEDAIASDHQHRYAEKEKNEGRSVNVGNRDKRSAFEGLCVLAKVVECIKPWWIQEGSHSAEEIEREAEKAASVVRRGLRWLAQQQQQQEVLGRHTTASVED